MTLLHLIVILVVACVGLYLFNTLVAGDARIKRVINVVVLTVVGIVALVWLLGFLGLDVGGPAIRGGSLR